MYLYLENEAIQIKVESKGAPFICIEPWYGRCDATDFTGTLQEREYGSELTEGSLFEAAYTISF